MTDRADQADRPDRASLRAGLATTRAAPDKVERALAELERWLADPELSAYRPQLEALIARGAWDVLLDSFYRTMPFGTGGRRGQVGIGTNRFNAVTLASSVQGHADFLRAKHGASSGDRRLDVVIAYDVRVFRDLRGVYDPALPNPALGVSSRDFAVQAACVYAGNGIGSHLLDPESGSYMSTPELSFFIRRLRACGGLNVSASHNHPDDNGGKMYDESGAQPVPPVDEEMSAFVERVREVRRLPIDLARARGLVRFIPPGERDAYVAMNAALSLFPEERSARIVYTPLHGTGRTTVEAVLRRAGFHVSVVEEQATYDGAFPACPYRIPNPEVPESMERACVLADRLGDVDLVLSTDPDADRIGVMVKPRGAARWTFLKGNEIGAIVTRFLLANLARRRPAPERPIVVKTEVTSDLIEAIARRAGARVVGDLLVGFKYVAEVIRSLEERGRFRDMAGTASDFVLGVEESHGILVTPAIRDKDAAGAALLLAELASIRRKEGRTILWDLEEAHREVGVFHTELAQIILRGAVGMEKMGRILARLRADPPREIAGFAVAETLDRWDERGPLGPIRSETDRASRNVIVLRLAEGRRIIVRPSGTEPKIKMYIEVGPRPGAAPAGQAADARALARAMVELALGVLGKRLRAFAFALSPLVSLDEQIDFDERFVAELVERARAAKSPADLASWADSRLKPYGSDPRRLVAPGVAAFLASEHCPRNAEALAPLVREAFGIA